jgi:hypothetical protein
VARMQEELQAERAARSKPSLDETLAGVGGNEEDAEINLEEAQALLGQLIEERIALREASEELLEATEIEPEMLITAIDEAETEHQQQYTPAGLAYDAYDSYDSFEDGSGVSSSHVDASGGDEGVQGQQQTPGTPPSTPMRLSLAEKVQGNPHASELIEEVQQRMATVRELQGALVQLLANPMASPTMIFNHPPGDFDPSIVAPGGQGPSPYSPM